MIKLIKNAVKITNDNIILTIPLIIFMWIIGAYLGYSKFTADTLAEIVLAGVTLLFLFGAFLSGWFYMVKKAVQLSKNVFVLDEERAKAVLNLFKFIPAGIGKYFLSFIGLSLLFIALVFLFGAAIYNTGAYFIGNLDLDPLQIKQAMTTPNDMKTFIDALSDQQLIMLSKWNLLFIVASALFSFFTFLWVPEIIYSTKNPFMALIYSIKKIFQKFLKTIKLFLFIMLLNFVISFISTFAMFNPFVYLLTMIIYFYFLVYVIVLIFIYYESEFVKEE